MQKPLIETVTRTKHQTMLSEADWPLVAVSREVPNDKNGHASGSTKNTYVGASIGEELPAEIPNSA